MGREGVSELGERELGKEVVCNWKRERERVGDIERSEWVGRKSWGERECVLVKRGVEEIE